MPRSMDQSSISHSTGRPICESVEDFGSKPKHWRSSRAAAVAAAASKIDIEKMVVVVADLRSMNVAAERPDTMVWPWPKWSNDSPRMRSSAKKCAQNRAGAPLELGPGFARISTGKGMIPL